MEKRLPRSLQRAVDGKFADRVSEGWTERDGWGPTGWTHWVWLKPGWRNFGLDPLAALHAIHESTVRDCLWQLREARPCDCDECERALAEHV